MLKFIDVEIPIESKVGKSVLELKGDRATRKYLLSPQDIKPVVQGWEVDPGVFYSMSNLKLVIPKLQNPNFEV